jgi:hypothetical protein
MRGRTCIVGLVILLIMGTCAAGNAHAHGLVVYVSTPVTPPFQLLYVLPAFAIVVTALNAGHFRRALDCSWRTSLNRALLLLVAFLCSLLVIAAVVGGSTSAGPAPGLAHASRIVWDNSWAKWDASFVGWNIFGLFLLALWVFVFDKGWTQPRWKVHVAANLALYVVCLIPFFLTGGYFHGWAGSYVDARCSMRIKALTQALITYAEQNNGNLPQAGTFDEAMEKIKPFANTGGFGDISPVTVCPLEQAWEKNPKFYDWSATYSGRNIRDFDSEELADCFLPFSCQHHKDAGTSAARTLKDHFERQKRLQHTPVAPIK